MLVVDEVHFSHGRQAILDGLTLRVERGELVGLVGPNGSGKTTLLRLASGIVSPSMGRVTIHGSSLDTLKPGQVARLVSVVPQNPSLPPQFTVLDLVLMGRNPHLKLFQREGTGDLRIAAQAMELAAVRHLSGRTIGTLSGGERQRVLIAMALAQEAPVLLLDEPTASLDLAHQTRVMDLVSDLRTQRGATVLLAMHDLTLAAQYCDRLVMLARGRSYADGPPEAVLSRENVAAVYGTDALVIPHPDGCTPIVLPSSGSGRRRVGSTSANDRPST